MALHVRCEGTGFVEHGFELGADVGGRRFDVVEPREEAALVELDLRQAGKVVVLRLLQVDLLLAEDQVDRLREARARGRRVESLCGEATQEVVAIVDRVAIAGLFRAREQGGRFLRDAARRRGAQRHQVEGRGGARIARGGIEIGAPHQGRDVARLRGEHAIERLSFAAGIAPLAAGAGELEQGGGIRGGSGCGHSAGIMGTRAWSGKTLGYVPHERRRHARKPGRPAGDGGRQHVRGPGGARGRRSRSIAGTCACGSTSPSSGAQLRDLEGAFEALREALAHRQPQLPGAPDAGGDARQARAREGRGDRLRHRARPGAAGRRARRADAPGRRARARSPCEPRRGARPLRPRPRRRSPRRA